MIEDGTRAAVLANLEKQIFKHFLIPRGQTVGLSVKLYRVLVSRR